MVKPTPPTRNPYRANHPVGQSDHETGKGPSLGSKMPTSMQYIPVLFLLSFGLSFLVVGSVFVDQCKLEPMVPIWLIIIGIFMMICAITIITETRRVKKSDPFGDGEIPMITKIISGILTLFFIAWFIAGNVWVYVAWGEDPDYQHFWFDNGCNKSVYLLSFWGMIFMDAFVGLAIIGGCVAAVAKCGRR